MYGEDGRPVPGTSRFRTMAVAAFTCAAVFLWAGCSNDESGPPVEPAPVVKYKMPERRATLSVPRPEAVSEDADSRREPAPGQEAPTAETASSEADTLTKVAGEDPKGRYTVRAGDSLAGIAGREHVYGDPLKWPDLFRKNLELLSGMPEAADFQDWELPVGLTLFYAAEEESSVGRAESAGDRWVVSVISSKTPEKICVPAVRLMKAGYRVYISTATVRGSEWLRLRVGFFKTRAAALEQQGNIASLVHVDDTWIARVDDNERARYGGL